MLRKTRACYAPYGLKHLIVDKSGNHVAEVVRGVYKAISTDRVILAPGPRSEVKVVQLIFDRFVDRLEITVQVARYLNDRGFRTRSGRPWVATYIRFILRNEKYIGTQTYNRTSARLRTKRIFNDPAIWIRTPNAFQGIVDPELFKRAQQLRHRRRKLTKEELLFKLRRSVEKHGVMTYEQLRKCRGMPDPGSYVWRFGSLSNAYDLIGEVGRAQILRRGRQKSTRLRQPILDAILRRSRTTVDQQLSTTTDAAF